MILLGLLAIVIGLLLAVPPRRLRVPRRRPSGAPVLDAGDMAEAGGGDALAAPAAPAAAGEAPAEAGEPGEAEAAPPRELRLGDTYTRAEIHAIVGGGIQDYLPHVDGRVVAGCFHPGYNPYAPFVVLPGMRPAVRRWALAFAAQENAVPCFLKRAPNTWEYVGDFRVAHLSHDPDEIAEWARIAEREGDVSMVLHLEEVRADDED